MKCPNNFNKIVVEAFSLLYHQYNKSSKFTALQVSVKRCKLFSFGHPICTHHRNCSILQQLNEDLRILKAGANMNTTSKPHRFWPGFDPVFFIWHLQCSFMNVLDFCPQGYELYVKFSK